MQSPPCSETWVSKSEAATLIADLNEGRFEITLLQVPEVIEPHVLSWFFDSSRIPGPEREGANRWRYENAELDELFERGRTEIELDERRAAYERVQEIRHRRGDASWLRRGSAEGRTVRNAGILSTRW